MATCHGHFANSKQGTGIVRHFLTKPESKADVKVVGKAVNRGRGYGMEVGYVYRFTGQQSYIMSVELKFRNYLQLSRILSFIQDDRLLLRLCVISVLIINKLLHG